MSLLVCCPKREAEAACGAFAPSHAVSLAGPDEDVPALPVPHRLVLRFHDIGEERPGLVAAARGDVAALLRFGRDWPGEAPLLVHCGLGISRSTAATLILACARDPDRPEDEAARALRSVAPCATPNPRLVALADDLLGRGGRLVEAVRAIGRGAEYRPYRRFVLPLGPGSTNRL